jgi:predicted membrane channel-forming protein YqfA (hemolysin III family)
MYLQVTRENSADCQVHMDGLGLSKALVSFYSAIFYCGGRDGDSRSFFFSLTFGLSVVRMPLSSVIFRSTPKQLSVTMPLLCRAPFDDRDVS